MYYTVVEDRGNGKYVYTGMCADTKEGLLGKAKQAFPQYNSLKIVALEGENPVDRMKYVPIPF